VTDKRKTNGVKTRTEAEHSVAADRGHLLAVVRRMAVREGGPGG
jgi:hypothetical protein